MTVNTDFETRRGDHIPVDLNQPLNLQIHHHNGDVAVRAVDRSDVFIVAGSLGHFGSGDESTFVIDVNQNQIRIQSTPGHGAGWPGRGEDIDAFVGQITKAFRRGGAASSVRPGKGRAPGRFGRSDISVEIPRAMTVRIEVHNASGDIQADGVSGEIQLTTGSGDIRLAGSGGELTLQTASGDVIAEGGSGRLTAHTASGDVRVEATQLDTFQVQTANGDIGLNAALGSGPFQAKTANGDVRLTLRQRAAGADEAGTLAYKSVAGDAHVSPPFRKIDHRRWQLGEGNGGRLIEVTTVSGDLTVDVAAARSGLASPAPWPASPVDIPPAPVQPEPPAAPPPPTLSPGHFCWRPGNEVVLWQHGAWLTPSAPFVSPDTPRRNALAPANRS